MVITLLSQSAVTPSGNPVAAPMSVAPVVACVIAVSGVLIQSVGDDEADIKEGKISISSPISRALIGKYPGDVAEVMAPGGIREYEILDVKYV